MENSPQSDSESLLFSKFRNLINTIDHLRDCGVQNYISLPRIVVLGSQSTGKSSVLESIVGIDFLPRGEGIVTRRPLELRLNHLSNPNEVPYAKFDEIPGESFKDFKIVRKKIDELTDKIAGESKNIVDKPIILNVFSPTCPDLTLIDLPGITRIPIEGQDEKIYEVTCKMGTRYCEDERTVILAVHSANVDMTLSDGLHLARKLDPEGNRTMGVLTKIDIMDSGSDARKMLLGKDVPLKFGFVGIKNRSQKDINENCTIQLAIEVTF